MAADTSSAPAANIPVVGAAAAALAAVIVEPILARSVAAVATTSGIAITNDMVRLRTGCYEADSCQTSGRRRSYREPGTQRVFSPSSAKCAGVYLVSVVAGT